VPRQSYMGTTTLPRRSWVTVLWLGSLAGACGSQGARTPVDTASQSVLVVRCEDYVSCEFACREGRGDACTDLARMFESGQGAPQNTKRAAELYEQACRMNDRDACAHLALMYDVGLGVGHDPSSA